VVQGAVLELVRGDIGGVWRCGHAWARYRSTESGVGRLLST
jgi:hypothetical protein